MRWRAATAEWVDWFNHSRLYEYCGDIPPTELEANPDNNMTETQVEYASVIRSSGNDLLTLLNDILDLAKVESGTVTVNLVPAAVVHLTGALVREFEPVAQAKGLGFSIELEPSCPDEIVTDPDRLRQVIKNLLTNAFKFVHRDR